ncbi:MAG TPA: hypothetical protein DCK98_03260 [Chloroflexi bacterium]|nr:hypothetical protein [Chloroflexota bacterium]HAL26493.1 hypothetical protein [Chloroflexota bacterium]
MREPGELIAMDIKSLGSIDRGGGHRHAGGGPRPGKVSWRHLHVAIDLASRLVYAELLQTARRVDTISFLHHAVAFFDAKGIRVRRVLTDNGPGYKRSFSEAAAALGLRHSRTKPYHPGRTAGSSAPSARSSASASTPSSCTAMRSVPFAVALYLAYYNAERPHTRLGGLPALEWLAQRQRVTDMSGEASPSPSPSRRTPAKRVRWRTILERS